MCFGGPFLLAWPKPLLTEFGIHNGLESCIPCVPVLILLRFLTPRIPPPIDKTADLECMCVFLCSIYETTDQKIAEILSMQESVVLANKQCPVFFQVEDLCDIDSLHQRFGDGRF